MKNIKRIIFSGVVLLSLFSVNVFAKTEVIRQKPVRRRSIVPKVVEQETFTSIPVSSEISWEAIKIVVLRDPQLVTKVFGTFKVRDVISDIVREQKSFPEKTEILEVLLKDQELSQSNLDKDFIWQDARFKQAAGIVISQIIEEEPELKNALYLANSMLREKELRKQKVALKEEGREEELEYVIEREVARAEQEKEARKTKIEKRRAERERKIAATQVDEEILMEESPVEKEVSVKPATSEMEIQTEPEVGAEIRPETKSKHEKRLKLERGRRERDLKAETEIHALEQEEELKRSKKELEAKQSAAFSPEEKAEKEYERMLQLEAVRKEAELKTETVKKSVALREKVTREKEEAEAKYELFKTQRKLANRMIAKDRKRVWYKLWFRKSLSKNQERLLTENAMEEAGKILGIKGSGEYKSLARKLEEAGKLKDRAKEMGVSGTRLSEAMAESAVFGMQKILPKETKKDPTQKLFDAILASPSTNKSEELKLLGKFFGGDSESKGKLKTLQKEQLEKLKEESKETRRLEHGLHSKLLDKTLVTGLGSSGYSEFMKEEEKALQKREAEIRLQQRRERLERSEAKTLGLPRQSSSLIRPTSRSSYVISEISESHAKHESTYGRKANHIIKENITVDVGSVHQAAFFAVYDVESFVFDKDSLYQTVIGAINSYETDIENQVSNALKQEFGTTDINFEIVLIINNQLYSFVKTPYSSIQHSKKDLLQGQTLILVSSALVGARMEIAKFARQDLSIDPAKEIKQQAIDGDFGQAINGSFSIIVLRF